MSAFDFEAHYKVDGYDGIAWYALRHPVVPPVDGLDEDEEDTDRVVLVMVGDDRKFEFGRDEVHKISEDSFCHGCGQIGCGWH